MIDLAGWFWIAVEGLAGAIVAALVGIEPTAGAAAALVMGAAYQRTMIWVEDRRERRH